MRVKPNAPAASWHSVAAGAAAKRRPLFILRSLDLRQLALHTRQHLFRRTLAVPGVGKRQERKRMDVHDVAQFRDLVQGRTLLPRSRELMYVRLDTSENAS